VTSPSVSAEIDRHLHVRYSAAVVRIERGGRLVYERAAGTLRDDGGGSAYPDTRFDLASITKVFVSTVALCFVARELLALDEPLVSVIPEWRGTDHAPITLRQILSHTAGFRSGADYRTLFGEHVETFALREPLVAGPGERVVYSDIGFLALGAERATFARGVRADETPATERDTWRGLVQGRVHDEKAALAGGVAGHAGLFGDARTAGLLCEWYLGPLRGRPSPIVAARAAEAIREQAFDPVLRRGLGWALKTGDANSCGVAMSGTAFGHTGFTGTCIWADPERDLTVVILTNAVHYGRHDLRDVRAAICDAAVASYAP
jgi:CubicO group peptidase (beta-lactamase class C family)